MITHMHTSRKTVKGILSANFTIELYSENIVVGLTKKHEAQLMTEDSCILELKVSVEDKLEVLIARGLVRLASSIQLQILNVNNRLINLKAKIKVKDLLLI